MFTPLDAGIAGQVHTQVTEFFESLNDEGAFIGRAEGDGYFVICDERVNPPDAITREFNLLIGFAALRPGEFHSYLISHSVSGTRVKPASLNRMNSSHYHPVQEEELDPQQREWVDRLADRFNS